MSTGCQKAKKTDRQEDIQSARQADRMTVWQNSRAAKEPAPVNSYF